MKQSDTERKRQEYLAQKSAQIGPAIPTRRAKADSRSYFEKLKDPRWQRKRAKILERDKFTCRDCGADHKTLHVHHCFYETRKEPWDCADRFLRTLCEDCHDSRGELEADAKRALGIIFSRTPHGPNADDLRGFVTSLVQMADNDSESLTPVVIDEIELDWLTDIRWFRQAIDHKPFRKCYETVTGRKANWKELTA